MTTYDSIIGYTPAPRTPVPMVYTPLNAEINYISYPASNFITTLGPVYLPRIYASNLSAFEIGSSGTIEYTLFDVSCLEMSRNVSTSNVILQTLNTNDSFTLSANNSNMNLFMNGLNGSNNVTLYGSNNVTVASSNSINLVTETLNFNTKNTFNFSASNNIGGTAASNIAMNAIAGSYTVAANNSNMVFMMNSNNNTLSLFTTCNLKAGASNNVSVVANSNISLVATEGLILTAAQSNLTLTNAGTGLFYMSPFDKSAYWYSACNITIGASNSISESANSNISLTAMNGSFALSAANGSNTIVMDSLSKTITCTTAGTMYTAASNNLVQVARDGNVRLTALNGTMNLSASNNSFSLSATQGSNTFVMDQATKSATWATACNMYLGASNDLVEYANSNVSITASNGIMRLVASNNTFFVSATEGQNTFVMDQATKNTTWATQGSMYMASSNNLAEYAEGSVRVTALNGTMSLSASNNSFSISATQGSNTFVMDQATKSATWATASNMYLGASNDLFEYAVSNVSITASNGIMRLAASNNTFSITATQGSNTFVMDQASKNVTWATAGNMYMASSNNLAEYALTNVGITALNGTMSLSASNNSFFISATQGSNILVMDQATKSLTMASACNMFLYSSNPMTMLSASNIYMTANTNQGIDFAKNTGVRYYNNNGTPTTVTQTGPYNLTSSTGFSEYLPNYWNRTIDTFFGYSENLQLGERYIRTVTPPSAFTYNGTVTESNNSIKTVAVIGAYTESNWSTRNVKVNGAVTESNLSSKSVFVGGAYLESNASSRTVNIAGASYVGSLGNSVYTSLLDNTFSASNNVYIKTNNNNYINLTQDGKYAINASDYTFNVNAIPTMRIVDNNVIIKGNLQIEGVIDSTNVQETNLLVQDKEIYLAYSSNQDINPMIDGTGNDKAGIIVAGCPQGINQNTAAKNEQYYEKSIKWNHNQGIYTNNSATESFWEVKGGSLKITDMNPKTFLNGDVATSKPVSFQIRINDKAELEIVKYYMDGVTQKTSVVAKFGRTPGYTL